MSRRKGRRQGEVEEREEGVEGLLGTGWSGEAMRRIRFREDLQKGVQAERITNSCRGPEAALSLESSRN